MLNHKKRKSNFWYLQRRVFTLFTLPVFLLFTLYDFVTVTMHSRTLDGWIYSNFLFTGFIYFLIIQQLFVLLFLIIRQFFILFPISVDSLSKDGSGWTRKKFWELIAQKYNWDFTWYLQSKDNKLIPFMIGDDFHIRDSLVGFYKDIPLRFFEYKIVLGNSYSIFAFEFKGNFPHIYLDRLDNKYGKSTASTNLMALPEKFRKVFEVHVPKKYEIEALQIFTPEILEYLLEKNINYDIELYENELIFIRKDFFYKVEDFENEFTIMTEFVDKISKNLNIISFKEIGNLSSELHYPKLMKKLAKFNLGSLLKLYAYIAIFLSTIFFLIELLRDISR